MDYDKDDLLKNETQPNQPLERNEETAQENHLAADLAAMDSFEFRRPEQGSTAALKKEDNKKKALILLLLLLLGLLALFMLRQTGVFTFPWESATPMAVVKPPVVSGDLFPDLGDATNGMLSSMTKEEIMDQMQIAADENYFSFKINTLLVFEDGESEAEIGIENPSYNVYPMVVQISLGEDGKGDMIYDSGGILPDYHIDRAKLAKELPQGTYKALAHLYAYDPDTQVNVFKSTAELTIIVNA